MSHNLDTVKITKRNKAIESLRNDKVPATTVVALRKRVGLLELILGV